MCERVFEGAARRVVALPARPCEARRRREEQHKVRRVLAEHLGQPHAHIYLGREDRRERSFCHSGHAVIVGYCDRMNHAVNLRMLLLDPRIGPLQRPTVGRIRLDIKWRRSKLRQPILLGPNRGIMSPTPDPHDPRLVVADHVFAPRLPDTSSTTNHHIDATPPVQRSLRLQQIAPQQHLSVPFAVPIAPPLALCIRRQTQHLPKRPLPVQRQIHKSHPPVRMLLRQRADQAVHARMRRIDRFVTMHRLALRRDRRKAHRLAAIAQTQHRLDQTEALHHTALLVLDDPVIRQRGQCRLRCQPHNVVDRTKPAQLFTDRLRHCLRRDL